MHLTALRPLLARLQSLFARWVEAEQGRFALWLPVAMTAGAASYFARGAEPALWVGGTACLQGAIAAYRLRHWRGVYGLCCLLSAAALGFAAGQFATWRAAPTVELPSHASIVTGTIRAVEILPVGRRVLVGAPRLDDGPALPRTLRIRLRANDTTDIATGDTLRVRALLMRPASPAFPGGWDLQRDAYFAGLGGYGTALNGAEIVARATPSGGAFWLQGLREAIGARIDAGMASPEAAIATTLLTGSATAIPPDDRAAFRDSGLAHLLAIAGLHIGIVMALVFGATRATLALSERAALFWPLKSIAAVAALAAGFGYLLLTGAHVPIIRSFAMACLVTLGLLVGRRALSLRGLGLAMAAIVLIAPNEVVGVSFQMSFSAVLALIVGYATLRPLLQALHGDSMGRRLGAHLAALALTSALAGTFSAPYGAYHFGHIQLYYVLANMVAVPITAMLVMPAGLMALALMPLHLQMLALVPMQWGITAILFVAHAVASLPAATLAVPSMPPWGLVLFSLGLAWLGLWRSRPRLAGLVAMAVGLASPAFTTPPDILVSADARLIALRSDGAILLHKTNGGSGFTQDAWQQYWALPPPVMLDCPTPNCLLRPRPGDQAAQLLRDAADASACDAALLISAEPIHLDCPKPVPTIDRFTVWREGAQAVWLHPDGVTIVSDRSRRGERPWVLGPPLGGRIPPGTKAALTEKLPD